MQAPRAAAEVVLIDDDGPFVEALQDQLRREGHRTVAFVTGWPAIRYLAATAAASLVVAEWRLADITALGLLRELPAAGARVPVMVVTAREQQLHEEAALGAGAVDFVRKSRGLAIIIRRIAMALRAPPLAAPGTASHAIGHLTLRPDTCRALWRGREVHLTHREFMVVHALATQAGHDLPYAHLRQAGWGTETTPLGPVEVRSRVRTLIRRVRAKFRRCDPAFDAIASYPAFGYRWKLAPPRPPG